MSLGAGTGLSLHATFDPEDGHVRRRLRGAARRGAGVAGGASTTTSSAPYMLDLISSAGVHAMGRGAYEEMAPYWQSSTDAFAKPMNEIPKAVFSRTLTEATWPESTIYRDLASGMAELKAQEGAPILTYGGATFAQELTRLGLVDEYRINVHPIAFGTRLPALRRTGGPRAAGRAPVRRGLRGLHLRAG